MKTRTVWSIVAISLLLGGCGSKTIQTWDTVSLTMTGTFENTDLFETKNVTITIWSGEVISGVESALIGMEKWEQKSITIAPENGYGKDYETNKIQKISKLIFDKIQVSPTNSGEVDLGGIKWTIKGTEQDGSGNTIILFDINPAQTWKPLIYSILVTDIAPENK